MSKERKKEWDGEEEEEGRARRGEGDGGREKDITYTSSSSRRRGGSADRDKTSSSSSSSSSSSLFSDVDIDDTTALSEAELKFILALINMPKKADKPVQAALIDYLGWEVSVLLKVGMHVSRTLGWDIRALYNKYDAIQASELIIERFDRLKILMPYITRVSELVDVATALMQKYKDTKLLLDSIIESFPLRCPNCSSLIYLTDKQNFFRFNILLYMKNLEQEMSSSSSSSSITTTTTTTHHTSTINNNNNNGEYNNNNNNKENEQVY